MLGFETKKNRGLRLAVFLLGKGHSFMGWVDFSVFFVRVPYFWSIIYG
jgi:hypothetical protein